MGDLYEPEEESITNDTPPYETHNTTIIIEEGGYYLFNIQRKY